MKVPEKQMSYDMLKLKVLVYVGTFTLLLTAAAAQAPSLKLTAKKAAQDAGCLDGSSGSYNYQVEFLGGCAVGPAETGAWSKVTILPKVSANLAPYVKLAPLADVYLCGNTEVLSVECLLLPLN